jgi:release factor glutamine methyltransferase
VNLEIIRSDLFAEIPGCSFDIIAINPPYYKKQPVTFRDHAWYCGENGEYFSGLFNQLDGFIHDKTETFMVLCDGCDIEMIKTAATNNGFFTSTYVYKTKYARKKFYL